MKKYPLISFAILLLPLFSFSPVKNFSLKWGPELEGSRRGSISSVLGYDDSGYYIMGYDKRDPMIYKINKKLDNAAEFKFEEKDSETKIKYEYEDARYFNDKLFILKSFTDRGDKLRELYFQELNKNTLKETGKPKKICSLTYQSSRDKGSFDVSTTKNDITNPADAKLLITIATPTDKDENEKFTLIMCDNSLKSIWKKDIQIPYINNLFIREHFICDDKGNAYVLGRLYKDKVREQKRGKQNYSYHLLSYTNKGETSVDYEIKLDDKFITDISFSIADNGDILAGGYFSKKGTYSVDGAFYLALNAETKAIKTTSFKEFDIDFITQGMTEKEEKKARKKDEKGKDQELFEYELHNIIKRSDGGVILIGEQYYVKVFTTFNGKSTTTSYDYHYHNIIIVNIDGAGKIEWAQTIPKRQISTNDGGFYSSFALAVTDDKLRFIYNDNRENLKPKKQGYIKNYTFRDKDGIVTLATIDKEGKVTLEALINDADIEVGIRPKVCNQINDHEILLFGEKRKKDQFAIISFEK